MKETVRERYARHAVELPEDHIPPTLGLGDPVDLANLQAGESILDLGSGPGRDLLSAARAVGPTGRSIGVDFTPEMIERAQHAVRDSGLENVSILQGDLERLPLPCGAVDVVISNCVINLVGDKRRALVEAYRVLRPGGRLAILDTAFASEPGPDVRNDPDAWCGCVGGSLVASDYEAILTDIGYDDVRLRRIDESCGEACAANGIQSLAVAVTARKSADAHPGPDVRPAVPADRPAIEALLAADALPIEGLRTEDALVALEQTTVIGAVALERHDKASTLRSLVVAPSHRKRGLGFRLVGGALDVARWSGGEDVYLVTENAQAYFQRFGFTAASREQLPQAPPECCSTASAMRLSFEEADLPMLGRPSRKELPTFENNWSCC